jgi:hypothetical protein
VVDHPASQDSAGTAGAIRVRDVVREVVEEVAPGERPLLDGLAELDDATVVHRLARRERRDPLGFGLGEILALVTPVVWLVLDEVAQRAAGAAVDVTTKGTKRLLRKVFRGRSAPVVLPELTPEQIADVRQRLLDMAAEHELGDDLAEKIAQIVVERLEQGPPPADRDKRGDAED